MKEKLKYAIWAMAVVAGIVTALTLVFRVVKQDSLVASLEVTKQEVRLQAVDGVELSADLYQPKLGDNEEKSKYPGVLLLSPFAESREMYSDFATELCRTGIVVLSVDVRNSGASKTEQESAAESVAKLGFDADAAVSYLQGLANTAPDRIAILGTGITARSALMVSDLGSKLRGAVLVSALMDSTGFDVIRNSPDCPVLVIVSIQDAAAAMQARDIYEASPNPLSKIESYVNSGTGSDLWVAPIKFEMMSLITEWLTKILSKS